MEMEENPRPTLQEIQLRTLKLVYRTHTDREFNHLCRREPGQAFREAYGFDAPKGTQVKFLEVAGGEMLFVLPPWDPRPENRELSDQDLEAIQGGSFWDSVTSAFSSAGSEIVSGFSKANDYLDSHTDGWVNFQGIGLLAAPNLTANALFALGLEGAYATPIGVGLGITAGVAYGVYMAVKH